MSEPFTSEPAAASPVAVPVAVPVPARGDDPGRLTVDQALAELDRQPPHILAIEARHGFVFGAHSDTGPGVVIAALACTNPVCTRRGQHVEIHDDSVLPVHCGGCTQVLHCIHQPETTKVSDGTIGAPIEHTITRCTVCGTELERQTRSLPPIDLAALPVAILDAPLS